MLYFLFLHKIAFSGIFIINLLTNNNKLYLAAHACMISNKTGNSCQKEKPSILRTCCIVQRTTKATWLREKLGWTGSAKGKITTLLCQMYFLSKIKFSKIKTYIWHLVWFSLARCVITKYFFNSIFLVVLYTIHVWKH